MKGETVQTTKVIKGIVIIKIIVALVAAWGFFTNPHIIRQVDTMGASLMYAKKFQDGVELHDFLPTTLAKGDLEREVTPMEFPILNLLFSPFFLIPWHFNFALAHMALILFNALLYLWGMKIIARGDPNDETGFSKAWMILPIYGLSMLFFDRFMPDLPGLLLVSLSVMMMWFDQSRVLSLILGSMALLMKPPLAIAYALFLLKERKAWPRLAGLLVLVLIPVLLYYTIGMKELRAHSQMAEYFAVNLRDPFNALWSFLMEPKRVAELLFKQLFYRYSIILLLIGIGLGIKNKNLSQKKFLSIVGVLVVQILLAAMLDGTHIFIHYYYLIGASFTACVVYAQVMKVDRRLAMAMVAFLAFSTFERSAYRMKPLLRGNIRSQCREINEKFPKVAALKSIRTEDSPIPELGLCMGKVANSKTSPFGVFHKNKGCKDPVYETKHLKLCAY